MKRVRPCLPVVAASLFSALCAYGAVETFTVGNYQVKTVFSQNKIMPYVTFAGRTFGFAYRTDVILHEGRSGVRCFAEPDPASWKCNRHAGGADVSYRHRLVTGKGKDVTAVGHADIAIRFRPDAIDVGVTAVPAEPGRFVMRFAHLFTQTVVFPGFAENWQGSTLQIMRPDGSFNTAFLGPHREFDPARWGINGTDYREVVFGNVPDIFTFRAGPGAGWLVNRYKGGFEISPALMNTERYRRPAWDKPVKYDYTIKLEK